MSNTPLVSVIIPTYNYSTVLKCAIESVLLQTMQDFELLVIGDGCTDDSEAVVMSFGDDRIIWENLPKNTGSQSIPNNYALDRARGKYIAYLGHDDLYLPYHLERLTQTLEAHDKVATASYALRFGNPTVGTRFIMYLETQHEHTIPGVLMHRRDLNLRWKPLNEVPADMTTNKEFSSRLRQHIGDGFMPTPFITELNFPAAYRPNIYKTQDSSEQEYLLHRIKTEPHLIETLLMETILLAKQGLYQEQRMRWRGTPTGQAGELVEAMRRFKGLEGDGRDMPELAVDTNPIMYRLNNMRYQATRFASRAIKKVKYEWHKRTNREK